MGLFQRKWEDTSRVVGRAAGKHLQAFIYSIGKKNGIGVMLQCRQLKLLKLLDFSLIQWHTSAGSKVERFGSIVNTHNFENRSQMRFDCILRDIHFD